MQRISKHRFVLLGVFALLVLGIWMRFEALARSQMLDMKPVIEYYPLGGYTEKADEALYVIAGDASGVKKSLNEIVVRKMPAKTSFAESDNLNLVVFRGVFSTGGYDIKIDKVERAGNTFTINAIYTDPGKGMIVTQAFTQPTAIIQIGNLPKGNYEAKLKVTKVLEAEEGKKVLEEGREHASIAFAVK